MSKKKQRKHLESKGEHKSMSLWSKKAHKKEYRANSALRLINQQRAWKARKNVVLTIENPNENEKNKKFIRINAKDLWGEFGGYLLIRSHSPQGNENTQTEE